MFRGGPVNPYDDIVAKATDENQTSENWEILLNLCDKVSEEGEQGARNVIEALLKRLVNHTANVQLYSLSVAEALSKNCDITVHREIASKAFTQCLEGLVADSNGHEKVRKRTLSLIKMWADDFTYDPQLGLMQETYSTIKSKGLFRDLAESPVPTYDDETPCRCCGELQRVLEMSLREKGSCGHWAGHTGPGNAGGSGSGGNSAMPGENGGAYPIRGLAYTPAARPSSRHDNIHPTVSASAPLDPSTLQTIRRAKALCDFAATETGELSFKKGDIIEVVGRSYRDWWRGELKGRVGVLPANYVELLSETATPELAEEKQDEGLV